MSALILQIVIAEPNSYAVFAAYGEDQKTRVYTTSLIVAWAVYDGDSARVTPLVQGYGRLIEASDDDDFCGTIVHGHYQIDDKQEGYDPRLKDEDLIDEALTDLARKLNGAK